MDYLNKIPLADEWPDFEIEQKFDWSLSINEMEHKYLGKPLKRKPTAKIFSRQPPEEITKEHPFFEKELYKNHLADTVGKDHIMFRSGGTFRNCKNIGKLKAGSGYGIQDVFYCVEEERYILVQSGQTITFNLHTLKSKIDFNGITPNGLFGKTILPPPIAKVIPKKEPLPILPKTEKWDFITWYDSLPQLDFHETENQSQ